MASAHAQKAVTLLSRFDFFFSQRTMQKKPGPRRQSSIPFFLLKLALLSLFLLRSSLDALECDGLVCSRVRKKEIERGKEDSPEG